MRFLLIALMAVIVVVLQGSPASACVEGLAWGMPLEQVHAHLGQAKPIGAQPQVRFEAHDVLLDRLPVSRVTFELSQHKGLQWLAYEFSMDDMTEVLAGLRARHGAPLSTSIEETDHNDQIWVWNTGEDLITAVKRKGNDEQKFLLSYRPSRLDPQTL
ncbi:hypothetical protein KR52_08285 [Synechococcus sp. KORDI-52]|uniref:hypothetical protein n=1 Tax=Synechococcus sp. KORDI-52 TaxID=585425 RepID=UPI0004E035BD|nr:hypothetical protein [Synechococcus sp. KORDI-52]AII49138.1 hypothetical protein KR52_08285 [Synechococcus sp. KORDI-52]